MRKKPSLPPSFDEVFGPPKHATPEAKEPEIKIAKKELVELVRQALEKYADEFPLNKSIVMRKIGAASYTVGNYFSQDRDVPLEKIHALIALFGLKEVVHFLEAPKSTGRISRMKKAAKANDLMHNPPKGGNYRRLPSIPSE